ncbi:hypothetical protein O9K63_03850 [Janibacter cremeus]|uniref:hypothetical protein n=1 Tax=Janibacter cremeus TaxID=1285192 RepID=UPI0023F9C600|nr:hypothetical protein [Janibacter cremeus]WEV78942.1 hypothetical protein O9K63_03850 [Janibacter cremeus]
MAERQHPEERDVDAIFASIVARWDETPQEESATGTSAGPEGPSETPAAPPRRQSTGDVRLPPPPGRQGPTQSTGDVDVPMPGRGGRPREEPPAEPVPWRTDPTNSVADALMAGDDGFLGDADDEEGYTPPPPAPLPPLDDRLFWGAVVGLVLGPLGLLWMLLTRSAGFWFTMLVIALILGGFACIVLRQPTRRGYDPDDGARV